MIAFKKAKGAMVPKKKKDLHKFNSPHKIPENGIPTINFGYILHIDNVHHYHISNAISVQVRARNRSRNRDFLDKKQRQRLKQNFGKKNAEGPLVK